MVIGETMEKYCKSCRRVFDDLNFKLCPYCGSELATRYGRQPIPRKLRHEVFKRDGYRCRECGASKDETSLEIDHIVPVARGGTNDINNLQTLCRECNRMKHTDEWVGGETDLDVAENKLNMLKNQLVVAKEKLELANNENEVIEYKFQVMKLKDDIDNVKSKIDVLIKKSKEIEEKLLLEKKLEYNKDKALKTLYVELDEESLEKISKNYVTNPNDKYNKLKYLINVAVEDLKFQELYNYYASGIDYFEKNKTLFKSKKEKKKLGDSYDWEYCYNEVKQYITKEEFLIEMDNERKDFDVGFLEDGHYAEMVMYKIISEKLNDLNSKSVIVPIENLEPGLKNISIFGKIESISDVRTFQERYCYSEISNGSEVVSIGLENNKYNFIHVVLEKQHSNGIESGDFVKIDNVSTISIFKELVVEESKMNMVKAYGSSLSKINFDFCPDCESIKNNAISIINNLSLK